MRARPLLLTAASVVALAAVPALAGSDNGYPVVPQTYDPGHLGTITAQWETHVGLPDAGGSDHALHLAKGGNLTDNAAAFAVLQNVAGTTVPPIVSFWIPSDAPDNYCGAGSPRWNIVTSDGVIHFLGCSSATKGAQRTDSRQRSWTQLTWDTTNPTQSVPPAGGQIAKEVDIVQDEPASTLIDDISYIQTMGKPGNGS
jgi:hypothetical protein